MSLNIKNQEAHELAQKLSELTGESLTEAVTIALRERLERLRHEQDRKAMVERILAIGRDAAPHFPKHFKSTDHGDMLYDERGLPK